MPYFVIGEAAASIFESWHSLCWKNKKCQPSSCRNAQSLLISLLWKALPDIIFGFLLFSLGPTGLSDNSLIIISIRWVGLPIAFGAYIVISLLQDGSSQLSMSRKLACTSFVRFVGYASLPICKFLFIYNYIYYFLCLF